MHLRYIGIFLVATFAGGCATLFSGQPKESRQQVIPKELVNSPWTLVTFQNTSPDCRIVFRFLDKGRFTFTIQNEPFEARYLYYVVKDSTIHFRTRPIDKIVWTNITCQPAPDHFARILSAGDKKYRIVGDQLFLYSNERLDFVFKKM
ncbi:MAG: hypothetical protein HOP30_02775 [Cyclobacteriaceae bacterium]|nr:hypothetical protein [Cyclobacteriaceae bacterium]